MLLASNKKKYLEMLLCIFLFTMLIASRTVVNSNSGLMQDETESLYKAERIFEGEKIYVDFFDLHAPLLYIILSPFRLFSLFDAQRVFIVIISVLTGLFVFLTLRKLTKSKLIQYLGLVLFIVQPHLSRWGILLIPEPLLIFFLSVFLYLLTLKKSLLTYFGLGILASLAFLAKQNGIILYPVLLLTPLLYEKKIWCKKTLFSYGSIIIGAILPFILVFHNYSLPELLRVKYLLLDWNFNCFSPIVHPSVGWTLFKNGIFWPNPTLFILFFAAIVTFAIQLCQQRSNWIRKSFWRNNWFYLVCLYIIAAQTYFIVFKAVTKLHHYNMMIILITILLLPFLKEFLSIFLQRKLCILIFTFFFILFPYIISLQPLHNNLESIGEVTEYLKNTVKEDEVVWSNWYYYSVLSGVPKVKGHFPIHAFGIYYMEADNVNVTQEMDQADYIIPLYNWGRLEPRKTIIDYINQNNFKEIFRKKVGWISSDIFDTAEHNSLVYYPFKKFNYFSYDMSIFKRRTDI